MESFRTIAGIDIPGMMYGTAWKKERTADLVELALEEGFRGIDTACQPRHYHEPGVGEGLQRAYQKGLKREDIFLQTKFTSLSGQDLDSVPYDPQAPLKEQVLQSIAVSLKNLGTSVIDSLVFHSPMNSWAELQEVWVTVEKLVKEGVVRQIGISNCYDLQILKMLVEECEITPSVVQNRFYAQTRYDLELRRFCREKGIYFQSFWTLTANPHLLESDIIKSISARLQKTPAQILFRFLSAQEVVILTGTSSESHMRQDLDIFNFSLDPEDIALIDSLGPFI